MAEGAVSKEPVVVSGMRPTGRLHIGHHFFGSGNVGGTLGREAFASPVKDFYLTNPIARASGVMAECSALARSLKLEAAE